MFRAAWLFVFVLLLMVLCASCGGDRTGIETPGTSNPPATVNERTSIPATLPVDAVQPWETVDASGKVTASLSETCEFAAGVERFAEGGSCTEAVDALCLTSGEAGGKGLSYAMYRLPLGTAELGTVGLDLNLKTTCGYFVGLSNYGRDVWEWHGPYTDGRVILPVPTGEYTSEIGNTFVCLVAYDGAEFDVVGVGAAPRDATDTTPPPVPAGLTLTTIAGGLQVDWLAVAASDLAGYRIYHSNTAISDMPGSNALCADYLEGTTRSIITGVSGTQHVRVSAVDFSGNESALSAEITAVPQVGSAGPMTVTVDIPSGMVGYAATITATGAETYDFDLNGDGTYDVTGDTTGTALVDTNHIGIIRPAVLGHSGTARACGAVSLLVSGNSRPVASALASPQSGTVPLAVTFTGTAEDLEDEVSELTFAWDFDGDGIYESGTNTLTPSAHTYTNTGFFNAKLRVEDTDGSWDVDTVGIVVDPAPGAANVAPTADLTADVTSGDAPLTVHFDASGSSDYDGTIVEYAWDWDGDGGYDTLSNTATLSHTFTEPGSPQVRVRVEDNDGAFGVDTLTITVNAVGNSVPVAALVLTPNNVDVPVPVLLDATDSTDYDGIIEFYEWDLDGDGYYDAMTLTGQYNETYTSAGLVDVMVRVTDDAGAQDTATATLTLNVPGNSAPVAALTSDVDDGITPLAVAFTALGSSDSDGTIVRFDWDFDGDGNYEFYDGGDSPSWMYTANGSYVATVRVTDDDGAQDTATVTISTATWDIQLVDKEGDVGTYSSLARVNGSPAISYYDYDNGNLLYIRACNQEGTAWNTPVTVDSSGDVGSYCSLCVADGNPAISYFDSTSHDLMYVRATDTSGSNWNTPVTVDSVGDVGYYTSMCVVNDHPAISYYDYTNTALKYVRASNESGSAWNSPVTVDSIGDVGRYTSMCTVGGNPAICYQDNTNHDLKYVRASNQNGGAWNTPLTVDSTGDVGEYTSMCIVNGYPAISYYDTTNLNLKYVRASNQTGSAWNTPLTIDSSGEVGTSYTCLCVVNSLPAISYNNSVNNHLMFIQATDVTGLTWDDRLVIDDSSYVGASSSMISYGGKAYISYYAYGSYNLKFAAGSF